MRLFEEYIRDLDEASMVTLGGLLEINPKNPEVYDSFDKRMSEVHESAIGFDPYIDYRNCYNRLRSEYNKYGKLIIAVDFDDTLCTNGNANPLVVDLMRRWKDNAEIVVWTSRNEGMQSEVKSFLEQEGLDFAGINIDIKDFGSRKIYANVYVDDRAGLQMTYQMLSELIEEIESKNI